MKETKSTSDENEKKYREELLVRSPRPRSPKSVRDFINERLGAGSR
jgi:hypothetical protein